MAPGQDASSGQNGPQSSLRRLWTTTNVPDYVGFTIMLVGWTLIANLVTPFHQMFFVNDLRIAYPHAEHERVPVLMNFVYALFIPLGILMAYNIITRASATKHEATYLPFLISIVLSALLTDITKNAVGRPRPDLLDRCQPGPGAKPNVLVTIDACTATNNHSLQDGWRSFPSGHASFSFAGLGFLSLFMAGQMQIFHPRAPGGRDLGRALLCLVPLIGAAMIGISRCEDYRHDVYDVSMGSLLGIVVAYWSYRRHWPRLSHATSHESYARPGSGSTSPMGWQRVRDEEEAGASAVGFELGQLLDDE